MGGSGLLQQQQGQPQSFPGSAHSAHSAHSANAAPLTQAHLLLNQQQQQQGGLPPPPSDSLSMQNFHGSMSQLGAPGITVQPPSALGGAPLTVQNPQPARPTLQNLPNQLIQVQHHRSLTSTKTKCDQGTVLPHTQPVPQPPPKKPGKYQVPKSSFLLQKRESWPPWLCKFPSTSSQDLSTKKLNMTQNLMFAGEGWGGRGARLPKIPVPLPSLPPGKGNLNGYFSHSFEEVIFIILIILIIITLSMITIIVRPLVH